MPLYEDRRDAGRKLARKIQSTGLHYYKNPIVLGIPRGGLDIGEPIAEMLSCPLEPVTLRKLPLPQDPEMGFGAINIDKEVIVNQQLVDEGLVSQDEIKNIADEVYREVQRRDRVYREGKPFPDLTDCHVIIADDGLATGYTMLAAVRFAKGRNAGKITAAVPVAHFEAYNLIKREVDQLICLYVDQGFTFAVASFYNNFANMNDDEVRAILDEHQHKFKKGKKKAKEVV
jgi:putative phosphoribosyl transferase